LSKIFISSDHAGYNLKEYIKKKFYKKKMKVFDLGPKNSNSVDYPIYAHKLSKAVSKNSKYFGILICGSGTGMNIAANKHKKIRAAACYSIKSTKLSRMHNNANIITLGSRLISRKNALLFIDTFLKTKFDGGRHLRRVNKIWGYYV